MKLTKHVGRKQPAKHLTEAERELRFAALAAKVNIRLAGRAHPGHPADPKQAVARIRALGITRRVGGKAKQA